MFTDIERAVPEIFTLELAPNALKLSGVNVAPLFEPHPLTSTATEVAVNNEKARFIS
jgi:hypothetical protein